MSVDYISLYHNAIEVADKFSETIVPKPMIVGNYVVESGLCGIAYLVITYKDSENKKFISALKKAGIAGGANDRDVQVTKRLGATGYMLYCPLYTQSYEIKKGWVEAMCKELAKHKIHSYSIARLD